MGVSFRFKKWPSGLFRIGSGAAFFQPPENQLKDKTNASHNPDSKRRPFGGNKPEILHLVTGKQAENHNHENRQHEQPDDAATLASGITTWSRATERDQLSFLLMMGPHFTQRSL